MKEIKYPVNIYDEPAEYKDFGGGINTDINDLGLLNNQMKSCINMHLDGSNLHVRRGGKEYTNFVTEPYTPLQNIQGVFILSSSNKYTIVANDGFLYYGIFNPWGQTTLSRLIININESALETNTSKVSYGLPIYGYADLQAQNHDGYIEEINQLKQLVFQNKFPIEAIQYKNKLYVTTGTRFIEVYEEVPGSLRASIVKPFKPNGLEYTQIGPNLLSYVPSLHVNENGVAAKTTLHSVVPEKLIDGRVKFKAIMSYANGETAKDYSFKWERSLDGVEFTPISFKYDNDPNNVFISLFKSPQSWGMSEIIVSEQEALSYKFRCTFATSFKDDYNLEDDTSTTLIDEETNDYVIDRVDGHWFGSAPSVSYTPNLYIESNEYYRQIQSCKKIFGYGNKFIIYDDAFNSGNFWKTVIDNPAYITYRGGLNFKTDKDEQIIKVINFKGIIVCFAFNEVLGGNISVVSGNGDDYNDGSNNYSPFSRRIVNKTITTDNANSVQIAENIIIFKYRSSLYIIEGSELNYEIVTVYEVNTHIKQKNKFIEIPFYDNDCISELTDDYYALYWKDKYDFNNDLIHPAYRLKMYFKNATEVDNRIVFPFLLDTSELFNTDFSIEIAGSKYTLYENKLISYNENYYKDLSKPYEFQLISRGYTLNYPQFIKSIHKFQLIYSSIQSEDVNLSIKIYNEALLNILKTAKIKVDKNVIDETSIGIKADELLTSYMLFTPKIREHCMNATVELKGQATNDFTLNSFTFYYKTRSVPKVNPLERYKKTIRKGDKLIK